MHSRTPTRVSRSASQIESQHSRADSDDSADHQEAIVELREMRPVTSRWSDRRVQERVQQRHSARVWTAAMEPQTTIRKREVIRQDH